MCNIHYLLTFVVIVAVRLLRHHRRHEVGPACRHRTQRREVVQPAVRAVPRSAAHIVR